MRSWAERHRRRIHLEDEMPKTREEVEALKIGWRRDPCWDIEDTDGFEEHKDELLAFHQACEAEWRAAEDERIKLTFGHKAERIRESLDVLTESELGAQNWIASQQVRATLLLAEQVAKLVDIMNNRPA